MPASAENRREGTLADLLIGIFLGWFFGILSICCMSGFRQIRSS